MSKKKKGLLPKVEVLILLVFFLSFIAWAATKCNATKTMLQEQAAEILEPPSTNNPDTTTTSSTESATTNATPAPAANSSTNSPSPNSNLSTLYITIEGLKLRDAPSLDSAVVMQFSLFEKVYFMEDVTEFKDSINLGKEVAYEPWVKVKSKKGHIGWVYGAGVHYHKKKRAGVE